METQEELMRYIPGHNDAEPGLADVLPAAPSVFVDEPQLDRDEKWPLRWTVLGLSVFCGAVWTALFGLIF